MYKQYLALNDQQGLICHKTQPINQPAVFLSQLLKIQALRLESFRV